MSDNNPTHLLIRSLYTLHWEYLCGAEALRVQQETIWTDWVTCEGCRAHEKFPLYALFRTKL